MKKTTTHLSDILYVLAVLLGAFAITGNLFLLIVKIFIS